MKAKRSLSALLAALMLTACAVGDTTPGDESSTQTEAATDEKKGPQDNLPADLTFTGLCLQQARRNAGGGRRVESDR